MTNLASIAIDMDGVLADVYAQFYDMHLAETGEEIPQTSMQGVTEHAAFPLLEKHVRTAGFFRNAKVMPSAISVVERLNQRYEVFIVSAAMEYPNSLLEKYEWLQEHFPFITWKQIILCGSKSPIATDIMIDDHFKNLNVFRGSKSYLFTQPHNIFADPGRHLRVNDWDELASYLL
ncbi:Putative 5'(3')-deoxyribonucleotidase [Lunatimonas lonarensis]|uniref:Putative 5'(3')-deoxyribonucleotidase n=1 Tax=Lunatimonas lonarensis TaxID=1232681 RepID=R7ZVG3_9BACT|nr:Putative 5'(3')-deoxyribonucleotidase [Lunatimonas lonarensis]EON78110.1 Putative 5'(3')-deoxyribonucleotidase [Lunatimonas lonarensis]